LRGGVQYDTRLDNIANGSASIEYRRDEDRMVQLSYRYASPEYIQATLPNYAPRNNIKTVFRKLVLQQAGRSSTAGLSSGLTTTIPIQTSLPTRC
jgi:lipopolysaccharide assembly outer membrane protein LptD (OstA)